MLPLAESNRRRCPTAFTRPALPFAGIEGSRRLSGCHAGLDSLYFSFQNQFIVLYAVELETFGYI